LHSLVRKGSGRATIVLVIVGVGFTGLAAGFSRLALARYVGFDVGAGIVAVSSLTSWFMASRAISAFISGVLADRYPRLRIVFMWAPMAGIVSSVYLLSLTRSMARIVLLNVAWGFFSGILWPSTQTVVSILAGGRSGSVMGAYFAVAFLGMAVGQYLYGVLPLSEPVMLRFSSLFFVLAWIFLAYAALLAPYDRLRPRLKPSARRLGGFRGFPLWMLLAAFASGYVSGMLKEFVYIYLSVVHGLSRHALAVIVGTASIAAFSVGMLAGWVADRRGPTSPLVAIIIAGSVGTLMLGLSSSLPFLTLGLSMAMIAARSSLPLTRNAVFLGVRERASALVGASNTLNNVGQVVGPLVSAMLYEMFRGMRPYCISAGLAPFLAASMLQLAIAASYMLVRERRA